MSIFFYVYRLDHIETSEFYYGSRKCECEPANDNYWGSMKTWKPDKTKLIKTIIQSDFTNHVEMIELEKKLILENNKNPLNRNYAIPSAKFYLTKPEDCIGDKNGFFSKHHTDEHKKRVSDKLKGENNPSFGKKWIYKDDIQKYIKKEELEYYLNEGWKLGSISASKNTPYLVKRIWLTDGVSNKYIKENEVDKILKELGNLWRKGKTYSESAKLKFKTQLSKCNKNSPCIKKGAVWMNDGIKDYKIQEKDGIEKGLKRGRIKIPWNKK